MGWGGTAWKNTCQPNHLNPQFDLAKASLERIGILGISLMALLSGFASISAPWQTFFVQRPHVRESDLARKEAGLTATNDMLAAKQSRHRALERKLLDRPKETSFFSKAVSSFRPPAEQTELKSLEMEISGLETMASALQSTYDQLKDSMEAARNGWYCYWQITFVCLRTALHCFASTASLP